MPKNLVPQIQQPLTFLSSSAFIKSKKANNKNEKHKDACNLLTEPFSLSLSLYMGLSKCLGTRV